LAIQAENFTERDKKEQRKTQQMSKKRRLTPCTYPTPPHRKRDFLVPAPALTAQLTKQNRYPIPTEPSKSITDILEFIRVLCHRNKYIKETLYIATRFLCNIFLTPDSYLSKVKMRHRKQLYLLATASVYVAAKLYEELNEPRGADLIESAPPIFNLVFHDLKKMERKLCLVLEWNLNIVTPHLILELVFKSYQMCSIKSKCVSIPEIEQTYQTVSNLVEPYFHQGCLGKLPSEILKEALVMIRIKLDEKMKELVDLFIAFLEDM
jgi:hypothetical protein